MKRLAFNIFVVLMAIALLVLPVSATDTEMVWPETWTAEQLAEMNSPSTEVTTTVPETELETEPVTTLPDTEPVTVAPDTEPVEIPGTGYEIEIVPLPSETVAMETTAVSNGSADSTIDWDKLLSDGAAMWEFAEDWLITNLDMVVGAILALVTAIMGLVTKFSFVPKIITSFKQLFDSVTKYHKENGDELNAFKVAYKKFEADVKEQVALMREQSEENVKLRAELAELYKEYIRVTTIYNENNEALMGVTMLAAEEMEDLIQTSPLTKADLDAHHEKYIAKLKLLESCQGSPKDGEPE